MVYDASQGRCTKQTKSDWKDTPISHRLWLTAFDAEVSLASTGDGNVVRQTGERDDFEPRDRGDA